MMEANTQLICSFSLGMGVGSLLCLLAYKLGKRKSKRISKKQRHKDFVQHTWDMFRDCIADRDAYRDELNELKKLKEG